jgi:histidinol-phosphatase (PHP family)
MTNFYPSNLHTHTSFSDGTDTPELFAQKAIEAGLCSYAFTDHAPIPNISRKWCIPDNKIEEYFSEIRTIQRKYKSDIEILCGLEVDYIPGIIAPSDCKKYNPDILIGSIHFLKLPNNDYLLELDSNIEHFKEGLKYLFNNDCRKLITHYYKTLTDMILSSGFDIAGHVDKIKMHIGKLFPEMLLTPWYLDLEYQASQTIANSNTFVEINTRGMYKGQTDSPYPSWRMIELINKMGGKLVLNADTHDPNGITGCFDETLQHLKKINISHIYTRRNNNWEKFYIK